MSIQICESHNYPLGTATKIRAKIIATYLYYVYLEKYLFLELQIKSLYITLAQIICKEIHLAIQRIQVSIVYINALVC